LLRGTGWDGMACIQPVRDGSVVRPLLDCSRRQVTRFLAARRLPSCEDGSNRDTRLLRNRVRLDILPLLRAINPNVVQALASTAEILSGEAALLEAHAGSLLPAPTRSLPLPAIRAAPPALRGRVVRMWLRAQRGDLRRVTAAHIRAVLDIALGERPGARVRLPGREGVVREYEQLRWETTQRPVAAEPQRAIVPGSCIALASGWSISAELLDAHRLHVPPARDLWEMAADAATVPAPLIVRRARPGDRVRPLGLRGSRKLQDVFVDRKLPRDERWSFPVVEAAGEVLWVPGIVRSGAALITPATCSALRLIARKAGIAGG
jgi:tRNA(Ile)-lysidine synthase